MSDLIPSINWNDFVKIVEMGKVGELQSCEILMPQHDFTVIIFHGDAFATSYARTQAEYLALRTNSVSGKTPAELMAEIEGKPKGDFTCPECERSFKARIALIGHMRSHRTKVLV